MAGALRRCSICSSSRSSVTMARRLAAVALAQLHHRHDVLAHRHAAEDRGFLRQVADAHAGALVHRLGGDVLAVQVDRAVVGGDQAGDHVEAGGLAGAVGAKQARHLARARCSDTPLHTTGRPRNDLPMLSTTRPSPTRPPRAAMRSCFKRSPAATQTYLLLPGLGGGGPPRWRRPAWDRRRRAGGFCHRRPRPLPLPGLLVEDHLVAAQHVLRPARPPRRRSW